MNFSYTVKTQKNIENVISDISSNLKDIGFGVLAILDFKKILNDKGQEFHNQYKLMEVCNPKLAKQVLEDNPDLGLLLPCTIAVYQDGKENHISLARPSALLKVASESNMQFIGENVEKKLIEIIGKSR